MTRRHPILAVTHGLVVIASLAAHLAGLVILAAVAAVTYAAVAAVAYAAGRRLVLVVRATPTRPDPVAARAPRCGDRRRRRPRPRG